MPVDIVFASPLFSGALDVSARAFEVDADDVLAGEVQERVGDADFSLTFIGKNGINGFVTAEKITDNILYISAIIVDPLVQGRGVARRAIEQMCAHANPQYLVVRTQSVLVWQLFRSVCVDVHPLPEKQLPLHIIDVAERCVDKVGGFPIIRGFYGGQKFRVKPQHRDEKVQVWWDSFCDFSRGDAVVCVGEWKKIT